MFDRRFAGARETTKVLSGIRSLADVAETLEGLVAPPAFLEGVLIVSGRLVCFSRLQSEAGKGKLGSGGRDDLYVHYDQLLVSSWTRISACLGVVVGLVDPCRERRIMLGDRQWVYRDEHRPGHRARHIGWRHCELE